MSTLILPSAPAATKVRQAPDLRRWSRVVTAAVLLVPGPCLAVSRLLTPAGEDTAAIVSAIAAAPDRQLAYALLGYLAWATIIPAFLGAARLSRSTRPALTFLALALLLPAYLGAGALFAVEISYLAAAGVPEEQRAGAVALIDGWWATGLIGVCTTVFMVGSFLGCILLGLALRGRVPALGWLALVLWPPAVWLQWILAEVIGDRVGPWLDVAAHALPVLAFLSCAVAVLRTGDDDWEPDPSGRPGRHGAEGPVNRGRARDPG